MYLRWKWRKCVSKSGIYSTNDYSRFGLNISHTHTQMLLLFLEKKSNWFSFAFELLKKDLFLMFLLSIYLFIHLFNIYYVIFRLFLQSPANPDLLYIIFFCHTQLTVTLLLALIFGSKVRLLNHLKLIHIFLNSNINWSLKHY